MLQQEYSYCPSAAEWHCAMRLYLSQMRLPWRLEVMAKGLGCWHCSEGAAWLGWPVARCSGCMACISGEPKAQHCSLAAVPDDTACYFEKPSPVPAPAETKSGLSLSCSCTASLDMQGMVAVSSAAGILPCYTSHRCTIDMQSEGGCSTLTVST